ncbi:MAG: glycosyltransferase [Patescibacteria group bacterium]
MNLELNNIDWVIGIAIIALIDFLLLIISFFKRRVIIESQKSKDFAILVPVFNNLNYLKNIPFLKEYSDHVYVLTTNKETEDFNRELEEVCNLNSFKLFKADIEEKQEKTPWLLYSIALHGKSGSHDMIPTRNIVMIDGDTYTNFDLENLVYTFEKTQLDISSLKILPDRPFTISEKIQYIEYLIAMQIRHVLPHLTSGAAVIGKKETLKRIYARHSMYFQGGDIETGVIAKKMNFNVGYIPFEFLTQVPNNIAALSKQRVSWASGTFRIFVMNIFKIIKNHPWELFYTLTFVYLLWYIKLQNLILYFPLIFITTYIVYLIILCLITFNDFYISVVVAPIFSLLQSFLLFPIGLLVYFRRVFISHNFGWIRTSDPKRNIHLLSGNHSLYSNTLELSKPKK